MKNDCGFSSLEPVEEPEVERIDVRESIVLRLGVFILVVENFVILGIRFFVDYKFKKDRRNLND